MGADGRAAVHGRGTGSRGFLAGIERESGPRQYERQRGAEGVCSLPYTTTHVEFEVFDPNTVPD